MTNFICFISILSTIKKIILHRSATSTQIKTHQTKKMIKGVRSLSNKEVIKKLAWICEKILRRRKTTTAAAAAKIIIKIQMIVIKVFCLDCINFIFQEGISGLEFVFEKLNFVIKKCSKQVLT